MHAGLTSIDAQLCRSAPEAMGILKLTSIDQQGLMDVCSDGSILQLVIVFFTKLEQMLHMFLEALLHQLSLQCRQCFVWG